MNQSLVMVRIGGEDWPLRSVPRCSTCQSPHRLWIEGQLVRGVSYAMLAREVAGMPSHGRPVPSTNSISQHVKNNHLPLPQSMQRRVIERRAKEMGKSVEDSADPLSDYMTLNQMIVQQGLDAIGAGRLELKASDVIAASKFLHDVGKESTGADDAQVWMESLMAYMEIAMEFIPPERRAEFGARLHSSTVLRALAEKQRNQAAIEGGLADPDDED